MTSTRPRILCVEKDADTCELLRALLGRERYEITCVGTVSEALFFARSGLFDLYLLEQKFCDGTGVELCERIRLNDPETPVVFFTSAAFERDRRRALEAGAQAYLVKPNHLDILTDTVRRLLHREAVAYA